MTGLLASQGATTLLKEETNRERPDMKGDKSFPSMHTSRAASQATLASRNLESIPMSNTAKYAFRAGFTTLAAGTAWARVEGRRHYLGDVLAGYSLGHFISAFINDAFLGIDSPDDPGLVIEASKDELIVGIGWAFLNQLFFQAIKDFKCSFSCCLKGPAVINHNRGKFSFIFNRHLGSNS